MRMVDACMGIGWLGGEVRGAWGAWGQSLLPNLTLAAAARRLTLVEAGSVRHAAVCSTLPASARLVARWRHSAGFVRALATRVRRPGGCGTLCGWRKQVLGGSKAQGLHRRRPRGSRCPSRQQAPCVASKFASLAGCITAFTPTFSGVDMLIKDRSTLHGCHRCCPSCARCRLGVTAPCAACRHQTKSA